MKKLAAVAVVCGVLIGCDAKPCNPKYFDLGEEVSVHRSIPAIVTHRVQFNHGCSYGYTVLLNGSTEGYFDQAYVFPKNEERKLCLTTRSEMGIFHPCSKREHKLKPNK